MNYYFNNPKNKDFKYTYNFLLRHINIKKETNIRRTYFLFITIFYFTELLLFIFVNQFT